MTHLHQSNVPQTKPLEQPAHDIDDTTMFAVRTISFKGHQRKVVMQPSSGPCPLAAIINVLSLRGAIKLDPQVKDGFVTIGALDNLLMEHITTRSSKLPQELSELHLSEALELIPSWSDGLNLNVTFNSIDGFEHNAATGILDLLGIRLVHGWLVDPQDTEAASVFSDRSYNQLQQSLGGIRNDDAHVPLQLKTVGQDQGNSPNTTFNAPVKGASTKGTAIMANNSPSGPVKSAPQAPEPINFENDFAAVQYNQGQKFDNEYVPESELHLTPCGKCHRTFSKDRIAFHEKCCDTNNKSREHFNVRKQRLSGLDIPNRQKSSRGSLKSNWRTQNKKFLGLIRTSKTRGDKSHAWDNSNVLATQPRGFKTQRLAPTGRDPKLCKYPSKEKFPSYNPMVLGTSEPKSYMADDGSAMQMSACGKCNRTFSKDRVAYHERVCAVNKHREPFNEQKQRLQGLDIPQIQSTSSQPATPKSTWRQQNQRFLLSMRSGKSRGGKSHAFDNINVLAPHRNVYAPLAPLPVGGVTGDNVEYIPEKSLNLTACGKCSRTFSKDRVAYHEKVCAENKHRAVFNPQKQRLRGLGIPLKKSSKRSIPKSTWRKQDKKFHKNIHSAKKHHRGKYHAFDNITVLTSKRVRPAQRNLAQGTSQAAAIRPQVMHNDKQVTRNWFNENCTQLTTYGITQLHANIKEHELVLFYRNNHYSVMTKDGKYLYVLLTAESLLNHKEAVWESVEDVSGQSGRIVDSHFRVLESHTHIFRAPQERGVAFAPLQSPRPEGFTMAPPPRDVPAVGYQGVVSNEPVVEEAFVDDRRSKKEEHDVHHHDKKKHHNDCVIA